MTAPVVEDSDGTRVFTRTPVGTKGCRVPAAAKSARREGERRGPAHAAGAGECFGRPAGAGRPDEMLGRHAARCGFA